MKLSNNVFFHSKMADKTGVGFVDTCIFGYSDNRIDTVVEAPVRFGSNNKITLKEIGAYTYTNYNCFIRGDRVGRYCSIGPNVSMGMGEHNYTGISTSIVFEMNRCDRLVQFTGLAEDEEFANKIIAGIREKKDCRKRAQAGGGISWE